MKDLEKLKLQYEKLGQEIKKLEEEQPIAVFLHRLPPRLDIVFSKQDLTFEEANEWCRSMNGRLPTLLEMQAIVDSYKQTIELPDSLSVEAPFSLQLTNYYWTSEKYPGYTLVYLKTGYVMYIDSFYKYPAICIVGE
jgi:hypothetical protein